MPAPCNFAPLSGNLDQLKAATLHKAVVRAGSRRLQSPFDCSRSLWSVGQIRAMGCVRKSNISFCGRHREPRSFSPQSPVEPNVLLLPTNTLTLRCFLLSLPLHLFPLLPLISSSSPPLSPSCLSPRLLSLSLSSSLTSSPEHLHCNTLTISHTPRGGVQLVHYVSGVFLRLMENTQNASAFHHSSAKRETRSVRESFTQQAAAVNSFSPGLWPFLLCCKP